MFLSVLLLSLLLAVFCPAVAPVHAASPTWSIQTLDTNTPDLSDYCPIIVDSNNTPHIAYTSNNLGGVTYVSWNGSAWNTQKVVEGTVFGLALDANNNPHILVDGGISGLMCTSWTGQNWTTQTVDKNGTYFGRFGALALDSAGNPHIAYTDNDKLVKYASWTGTNWNIQTIDTSQSEFAPRVSLTIDSNNTAYLMYGSLADVKLAVYNNSNWTIQTVASNMDSLGNIVLDSKGYPHFIYAHNYSESYPPNNTIMYVSWNGTAWNAQQAVTNVSMGGVGARDGFFTMGYLSLDSNDSPHIAYVTSSPEVSEVYGWGFLAYASWTGRAWDIQTVNSTVIAQSCYLAVDSNGNPHISLIGVLGSEAARLTGPYSWTAPIMYATATEPTQPPSSPFSDFAPLVISSVIIVAIIATVGYVWKRKIPKKTLLSVRDM
jgi:hypothetical protein